MPLVWKIQKLFALLYFALHVNLGETTKTCDDIRNIALNKTCQQSSVRYNGQPNRAVDGNRDAKYELNSCTHTYNRIIPAWWEVDLGANYTITRILITNRDIYGERLQNLWIEAGDGRSRHKNGSLVDGNLCSYLKVGSIIGGAKTREFICNQATTGRYVSVAIIPPVNSQNILTLCEVEVYGCSSMDTIQLMTSTEHLITTISTKPAKPTQDITHLVTSAEISTTTQTKPVTSTTRLLLTTLPVAPVTSTIQFLLSSELPSTSTDTEDNLMTPIPTVPALPVTSTPLSTSSGLSTTFVNTEDYSITSLATVLPDPLTAMNLSKATNYSNCCLCNKTGEQYDNDKIIELIEALKKELTVDKRTTSMQIRKRTSAPDDRSSSKNIGIVGVLFLILVLAVPIMLDVVRLIRYTQDR